MSESVMAYFGFGSKKMRFVEVSPPTPSPGRDGVAIVAIVLNVERYVEEWLTFHLAAGVSHFFIYDNGSTDGTLRILESPVFADAVTVIPWRLRLADHETRRRLSAQVSAYSHAVTTFGPHCRRMAFIDIDEFLVPHDQTPIPDILDTLGDVSNISLPWHMFGHNGHKTPPEGGVVVNYTKRARTPYTRNSPLNRFKCIVDPCRLTMVGVHEFATSDMGNKTANMRGMIVSNEARKNAEFFTSERLQLNHYYLLSETEFERKMSRGPVNSASKNAYRKRLMEKVADIETCTQPDFSAVEFIKAKRKAVILP